MQNNIHREVKKALFLAPYTIALKFIKDNLLLLLTILLVFTKSLIFISYIYSPTGTYMVMPYLNLHYDIYISITAMIVSTAVLFKGKVQVFTLIFINLGLSLFLIFDLMYFRGFQNFISLYNLSQRSNLANLGSSIMSMLRYGDILFIIDVFIFLLIKKKWFYMNTRRRPFIFLAFTLLGLGLPLYSHYRYDVLENRTNRQYFFITDSPRYNIACMSPIGYHVYESYKYFENSKRLVLSEEDKKQVNNWYSYKKEDLPDNEYKGLLKGKNLILMQIESLESFLLGRSIDGQEITPSLNKLLKNSLFFSQIHEQVKGGTSSDGDLIANTSTYPVRDGSTFFRFPDNKYNSLAILMKRLGYYTSAYHPDGGGYWNWMPALQSMGFDKCTDVTAFKQDEVIGIGLSDGSFLRQLKDMIKSQPQPFYTFFVTLTSHGPFNMPEDTKSLKLTYNIEKSILGDYFHAIHYTDEHIGNFIDGLSKEGILDNSVLVIYGDHAGITKYYKDKVASIAPGEQWWLQEHSKVPLIIYSKELQGREIQTIGGQVDILPTVAYLMGIDEQDYINKAIGRNLLKTNKNFAVLSDGRYIGDYKDESERNSALEGLNISDKMLRSNFFK